MWQIYSIDDFKKRILVDNFSFLDSKDDYYKDFEMFRKKNGERKIYFVSKEHDLYKVQRGLCKYFFNFILLSEYSYAFVKQKNYFDYLQCHTNKSFFLRLDIRNFFDSINEKHIRENFEYYMNDKMDKDEKEEIINKICEIVLYENKLPQGAVTSPVVSNIIFRELDIRIAKYCMKAKVVYSRYADDLLFSSDSNIVQNKKFIKTINYILKSKDFDINYDKIIKSKDMISLNGYVVDSSIRLSRKKLENLSKSLIELEQNKIPIETFFAKYAIMNYLSGNRAFIISAIRYCHDDKYRVKLQRKISKIEKMILKVSKVKINL